MKKIFIDSDVILDLLLDRKPYSDDIAEIIEHSLKEKIIICVSSVTITNLNYIIARLENKNSSRKKTAMVLKLVKVENVGVSTVHKSMASKFSDFEDGVQNFCAEESKHQVLVTRNTKDYRESDLAIMTPREYLTRTR